MESRIEKRLLERTGRPLSYPPGERIGVIVAETFPGLGTMTAMRFLEWAQEHPEGVVSLPTGKTPEYFIREVERLSVGWHRPDVVRELEEWGIDPSKKPSLRGLRFVQIDEFYPMNPRQHNSFLSYVTRFYLEGFGIDPSRSLLIDGERIGIPRGMTLEDVWGEDGVDLTLRYRRPIGEREALRQSVIREVDQWCVAYEDRIRSMGGIGFFLGGIGPDGHIGFNVAGSDLHSTTRLSEVNYETQAAAASDLGGIEVAKKRLVITIGLATITYDSRCTAIVMAAGEAKAAVVARAVVSPPDVRFPASVLQSLPEARFYLTRGAAKLLRDRNLALFAEETEPPSDERIEKIVIDLAVARRKRILDLSTDDYRSEASALLVLEKTGLSADAINRRIDADLKRKIEEGMRIRTGKRFLHTEPHHDDIMLGYLPFVVRHIREHSDDHHFVTFTSGFTAVTNRYMLDLSRRMKAALEERFGHFSALIDEGYFDDDAARDRDVWLYLDGIASDSESLKDEGTLRRFLRDLIEVFEERDLGNMRARLDELEHYFRTQYPGKKDLAYIQTLKGMCREWESACLWGYFGWNSSRIRHLRLGFYTGDIFTEEPTVGRDVAPVAGLLDETRPDVLTLAFDPEASGPDTHYKVLQAVAEGLKRHLETDPREIEVIGYRNVWYRFHPSEANVFVPVSLNMLTLQHSSFMNAYLTQRDASFPSWEYDGPFSLLAQKIQVEQYETLLVCLGREFFNEHTSALIRATRGFVFLRSMKPEEFYRFSRELHEQAETRRRNG